MQPNSQPTATYNACIHPREQPLFILSIIVSTILWISLIHFTMGMGLLYALCIGAFSIISHALFIASIRGYGIQVTAGQFPDIYDTAVVIADKLCMGRVPDIYIYNMDGIFNAFATHFFSRNCIILSTSILDACDNDIKKIEFILAHEMVHLQRGHTRTQFFLFPSSIFPWIGAAYSRACEYSCDGVSGRYILDDKKHAIEGILLISTADLRRARRVDLMRYEEQRAQSGGFWMSALEASATHPFTFNRTAYIQSLFGESVPTVPLSLFGMIVSPFFSLRVVYPMIVLIIIVGIASTIPTLANPLEDIDIGTNYPINQGYPTNVTLP